MHWRNIESEQAIPRGIPWSTQQLLDGVLLPTFAATFYVRKHCHTGPAAELIESLANVALMKTLAELAVLQPSAVPDFTDYIVEDCIVTEDVERAFPADTVSTQGFEAAADVFLQPIAIAKEVLLANALLQLKASFLTWLAFK